MFCDRLHCHLYQINNSNINNSVCVTCVYLPVGKMVNSAASTACQNVDGGRSIAAVDWFMSAIIVIISRWQVTLFNALTAANVIVYWTTTSSRTRRTSRQTSRHSIAAGRTRCCVIVIIVVVVVCAGLSSWSNVLLSFQCHLLPQCTNTTHTTTWYLAQDSLDDIRKVKNMDNRGNGKYYIGSIGPSVTGQFIFFDGSFRSQTATHSWGVMRLLAIADQNQTMQATQAT